MDLQDSGTLPAFTAELPPTVFRIKSMTTLPSRTAGSAVALEQLSKSFGTRRVLGPIQLEIDHGEVVSWIGASGCGKTTLLRILAGLEAPSSGIVRVGGSSPKEACIRQDIGIAFQRSALSPSRTALQNVQMTLEICNGRPGLNPRQLLTDFGLAQFLDYYPHELSGGMLQRVNIACALVHQPRLLLLDEPFGALDELTRNTMSNWLADVLLKSKQTAVLVTHSVEEAVTLSDRICIFSKDGLITQSEEVRLPRPRSRLRDEELYREITRIRKILHGVLRGEMDK